MFQIERQQLLIEYIDKNKKASIEDLSKAFNVSKVTIRRDLIMLAEKKLILKTHGGAMSIGSAMSHEIPYAQKVDLHSSAKEKIGIAAASLIRDHDIIIIDTGSTTYEVADHITQENVTVLTNDLRIGMNIAEKGRSHLLVAGGILNNGVFTLVGENTINFFKGFRANKTYLGCDAFTIEYGITNRTIEEVSVKREMIRSSEEVILVTDYSKFGKQVFCHLCEISEINQIIIDKMDKPSKAKLESLGIKVTITGS